MPALVKENRRWRERNHKEGSKGMAGNKPQEMKEGVTEKYNRDENEREETD